MPWRRTHLIYFLFAASPNVNKLSVFGMLLHSLHYFYLFFLNSTYTGQHLVKLCTAKKQLQVTKSFSEKNIKSMLLGGPAFYWLIRNLSISQWICRQQVISFWHNFVCHNPEHYPSQWKYYTWQPELIQLAIDQVVCCRSVLFVDSKPSKVRLLYFVVCVLNMAALVGKKKGHGN